MASVLWFIGLVGLLVATLFAAVRPAAAAIATARGCTASDTAYALPAGAGIAVLECDGARPVRAFLVRYVRRGELAVAPLVWRGRFVAEQLTARAGDVLRIGGPDDVIAG